MTPPRKMPEWAYNQMIEGLQKLLVLRLSGAPPADTVTALAAVWEEALTPYTWYYDKNTDGRRLPQAFAAVVQAADKWVQPAHVIAALPPRPETDVLRLEQKQPALSEEERQDRRADIARMLTELRQSTAMPRKSNHHF